MKPQKFFLGIFGMALLGMSIVLSKFALREFSPLVFHLLRFGVIAPLLFIVKRPPISWGMLLSIGLCLGVLHIGLVNLGLFLGATAGSVAFFLQTGGFFSILFAYFLFGSKPSWGNWIGMLCGFFGIYWLSSDLGIKGGWNAAFVLIASACSSGLGYVLTKKCKAPAVSTSIWMSGIVISILAPFALYIEGIDAIFQNLANASYTAWSFLLGLSYASTIGAGSIVMYLMRTEKVAHVAGFQMLIPCFGALFGFLILNENIASATIIGGAFILLGVFFSQFADKIFKQFKLE